jgi:uncharacterized protein YjiS (DUF1127 family)
MNRMSLTAAGMAFRAPHKTERVSPLKTLATAWSRWTARMEQRRELAQMSDRLLADIGLDRESADRLISAKWH